MTIASRWVEGVRPILGLNHRAAAQEIRRFRTQFPHGPEKAEFKNAWVNRMSQVQT